MWYDPVADDQPEPLPHRVPGEALDKAMAQNPAREDLEITVECVLPGPGAQEARDAILGAADEYAARLIEACARPDDRWEPVRDGSEGGDGAA